MSDLSRVEEIFVAALETASPEECAAYLDEKCQGDPEVRQRVEQLLLAHVKARGFLEFPRGDQTREQPSLTRGEEAGAIIAGRYKLLERIGEGGMGAVFMAQQTEPVKRLVALKVVKPGMDSKQVLARFEAERQALALMDHPSIAKVLDGGLTERGRPYFVMELVKGVPITRYCDERKLTPRERLALLVPVCQAIQHAHQKGVIHRDIKPSNVLVAQYDGQPVPKVIDFGVAKATGQLLTEKTLVTGFGALVGTLEYMSPEQAELNQLDIDNRSDVYSLGVLLYELLTGTTPIQKERLKTAAILEMLRVVREEQPPRPSTRLSTSEALASIAANRGIEPKALTGLLRSELDWIVMKALEKDRNRRYASPEAFVDDIKRYLRQDVVLARPPSFGYRIRKYFVRHRAALLVSSTFLLMLTTLLVVSIRQVIVPPRGDRTAMELKHDALTARKAESEARKAADLRVFMAKFQRVADQATHLALGSPIGEVFDERRETFLRLAYLLREVPDDAPAWRDHLVMTLILAGRGIAPPADLPGRHGFDVQQAALSSGGRLLATATSDGTVQVRDYPSLAIRCEFNPFVGAPRLELETEFPVALGFLDRHKIVWTEAEGRYSRWDSTSGRAIGRELETPYCNPVWSPDSSRVVTRETGMFGQFLNSTLRDARTGERIKALSEVAYDVAFSPDGSIIVEVDTYRLRVWSATDGSLQKDVPITSADHLGSGRRLRFSPSGRFLVITSETRMVWFQTLDWHQEPSIQETGGMQYPVWAEGSDELLSLRSSPDPFYWHESQEGKGVRRRSTGLLGYAPIAVRKDFVLTDNGDIRELGSGRRLPVREGRAYAEEARYFAADDRWLRTPKGLIDLAVDRPVLDSPGIRFLGEVGIGWACAPRYDGHPMDFEGRSLSILDASGETTGARHRRLDRLGRAPGTRRAWPRRPPDRA